MARIPLGLGPSLHQLRSRSLCLVRRLHSYYGLVRRDLLGLTWAGLAPADRASFAWRLRLFDRLVGASE